jgi:hypothetical protein
MSAEDLCAINVTPMAFQKITTQNIKRYKLHSGFRINIAAIATNAAIEKKSCHSRTRYNPATNICSKIISVQSKTFLK